MRPTHVVVNFSESPWFEDGVETPFEAFEKKARQIAWGSTEGYIKTHVSVFFDNDAHFACRIDLQRSKETCFYSYVQSRLDFLRTERFNALPDIVKASYRKSTDFMELIDFSDVLNLS
ncbi:LPD25 domain-containing protein [Larsenimonas suaedae]|uniref:Large polyvalent protein associated domain-containing protein n=1 Tax=Larsenimonas suaedae TaxID=1851019 RepID=A0ABU1H0X2_9GAMM|nr:LPD25 domain-containing protein [Larsenimonas suaedae]MCM2973773.1 hypothetical protein [Larsenimonas suaedae]MDR5897297.1 hypothetical protein [Larsenimonas suaedae]